MIDFGYKLFYIIFIPICIFPFASRLRVCLTRVQYLVETLAFRHVFDLEMDMFVSAFMYV